jgi:Arc/MetJ-type ribon-helix-helix transcriptional regulator
MSKTITVRIDDDLQELIEKRQDESPYDIPTSEIVRTALREHLSGNADAPPTMATAD